MNKIIRENRQTVINIRTQINSNQLRPNGITLVALVITIIVLLILAGITISLILGDNGILTKARQADLKNDQSMVKEALSMRVAGNDIDKYAYGDKKSQWSKLLAENIITEDGEVDTNLLLSQTLKTGNGTENIYVIEDGKLIYYEKEGNRTDLGELWKEDIIIENPELLNYLVFDKENGEITGLKNCTEYYGINGGEQTIFPIEEVIIPKEIDGVKVESIGKYVFYHCASIKKLVIQENINYIGSEAFGECENLEKVIMKDGVTTIEDNVFWDCTNLKTVQLSEKLNEMGINTFGGCELLEEINIPIGITSINYSTFNDCVSLKKIEIPSTVTTIGNNAFSECKLLEEIEIPSTVTTIGEYAFSGCKLLEKINIPTGITSINHSTFKDCVSLKKMEIPSTVTTIGEDAFRGCKLLEEINIPIGVVSIEYRAFLDCVNLKELEIPSTVTEIGIIAFGNTDATIKIHKERGSISGEPWTASGTIEWLGN